MTCSSRWGRTCRSPPPTPLVGLITWPVRLVGGAALQLNLIQIGTTFLAAWFTYVLAMRLCGRRGPAVLAGAAFAFAPYRLVQLGGHLNIVHIFWVPLCLLSLLGLIDRPCRRTALILGASLAGAFLTDPQIALLVMVALGPVLVHRRNDLRTAVRPGLIASATR